MDALSVLSILICILGSLIGSAVIYLTRRKQKKANINNTNGVEKYLANMKKDGIEFPVYAGENKGANEDVYINLSGIKNHDTDLEYNKDVNINMDPIVQEIQTQNEIAKPLGKRTYREKAWKYKKSSPGQKILIVFSIIVFLFALFTIIFYWNVIITDIDSMIYFGWLFLTMSAGMFIRVLSGNYKDGKDLFDVSPSRLIFPLLFSVIVFYPVWSLASSAPRNGFSIYAAFLNGFFWETVVSSVKSPTVPGK